MLARKALAGTAGAPKVYVEDVFSTYLYTGNGSTQTITNGIDLSGEGGMVWNKMRSTAGGTYDGWHRLTDTVRGYSSQLYSNSTGPAETQTYVVTSFNSDGFSLGNGTYDVNKNGKNYASWTFRKAKKFFDVVTFTTDSGGQASNISHSLSSVPGCILIKKTSTGSQDWKVYHRSLTVPTGRYLELNSTTAEVNPSETWVSVTSTTIGFPGTRLDGSATYVAYLFAHDAGGFGDAGSDSIIKCGSFTTDGSGNATVDLGWEPQWVVVKRTDSAEGWFQRDIMRGMSYSQNNYIYLNTSDAESAGTGSYFVPTATGFTTPTAGALSASATYIYIAIRRGPMKTPTVGTSVYTPIARSGNSTATTVTGVGFPPDLVFEAARTNSGGNNWIWFDRLRGGAQALSSDNTGAEFTNSAVIQSDSLSTTMDGFRIQTANPINSSGNTYIYYPLRRAPGFFDVVCWKNNNTTDQRVKHNLAVTPELIITKPRDTTGLWHTYASGVTSLTQFLQLESTTAVVNNGPAIWGTAATSTEFGINSTTASGMALPSATMVAYLFASVSGVSKVGSYTGNGSSVTVTTDFQPRFILVKRTDSTGDWIVSDSARGLVAGNDPYLLLNSTAAEDTDEDWVDITSTSFTVNQTTAANANVNTGTYIYLAIA